MNEVLRLFFAVVFGLSGMILLVEGDTNGLVGLAIFAICNCTTDIIKAIEAA